MSLVIGDLFRTLRKSLIISSTFVLLQDEDSQLSSCLPNRHRSQVNQEMMHSSKHISSSITKIKYLIDPNDATPNGDLTDGSSDGSHTDSSSNSDQTGSKFNKNLIDACLKGDLVMVQRLLDDGVNVDLPNENGNTALILASLKGHLPIVKALLEKHAKTDVQNYQNKTALDVAKENGHTEILCLLAAVRLSGLKFVLTERFYISFNSMTETGATV